MAAGSGAIQLRCPRPIGTVKAATGGRVAMPTTNDDVQRYLHWLTQPDDGGLESLSTDQRLIEGLEASSGDDDERIHAAFRAVDKLARRAPLDDDERGATEAIIIPGKRPVVDIVNDTYVTPGGEFAHFGDDAVRGTLAAVIPSVGRIELPDHPCVPYGGTGFLVGDGLLMTNRHVAELFASGIGRDGLSFVTGRSAGVDFLQERDRDDSAMFTVANILMVHPFWDLALLAVIGLDGRRPLRLTLEDSASLRGRDVAVIGY